MKKNRTVLVLGICAGAAALALAILAFRFAKHEEEYRKAETRKILLSECGLLAGRCLDVLKSEEKNICSLLRNSDGSINSLSKLQMKNPLIKQVFATDASGNPVYPGKEDPFCKTFSSLFYEHISVSEEKDEMNTGKSNKSGASRLLSRFGIFVKNGREGWIPWITENRLCPVIWARSVKNPSRIYGAEIELMALLSKMVSIFPQNLPDYFSMELTDTQGKTVCCVNFMNEENGKIKKSSSDVIIPVSQEMVPGWQIKGYLNMGLTEGGRSFALFNLMQIVSLIFILLACGALILWLARREMELAGQKTSFVANVSHELKTPLTSIRMYSEMLLHNKEKITEEKQTHYLSVILSESERLSRLISNVLNFSRMEAGQKKYNPSLFNLKDFLDEICEIYRPSLMEKGIDLKLESSASDIGVFIDRDSLAQIMENLISNARKYAASGKELTISLENSEKETMIKVMDMGKGIPVSAAEKIFNKFYRCDNSLTAETRGNGLGLTIARGMMRDQGGDILYRSREGGGSEFRVIIRKQENS
ncbi:MAG: hypothetical protein A2017_11425 [Lentisphaerae bacterium GWF2_44_16]|nr:MAG: hypothetical protein A2017_11425 [Lentisphaerae bacterium GWF2_44_16]